MPASSIITLTTDFGTRDAYVAAMKGVILSRAPGAVLVDVSHEIAPQSVEEAAYLLESVHRFFPQGTVHLAVVDPGVGSQRKPIAVQTAQCFFVGPDNGIFSTVLFADKLLGPVNGSLAGARAVELQNEDLRLTPVSNTFHGRDVFAPAAAHLATGGRLLDLGPELKSIVVLERAEPIHQDGMVRGTIVHIDRFGNAVTNIPGELVAPDSEIVLAGMTITGLSSSYQDRPIAALVGSTGRLEIAARNGSAAEELGVSVGDPVIVRGKP
jgi:S-adenosylmethionine hydrolase